jgi:hypothetical protein
MDEMIFKLSVSALLMSSKSGGINDLLLFTKQEGRRRLCIP